LSLPFDGPTPIQTSLRRADAAVGCLLILWLAEATVRLPAGTALTVALYGWFALRMLMTLPRLLGHLARAWPVFVFPAVAALSVAWSADPATSLTGAAQLTMTLLIAIFMGAQFGLRGLAWLVAAGLGASMVLSAVNLAGIWQPILSWEGGFLGIYSNKNALGQRAALLLPALLVLILAPGGAPGMRRMILVPGLVLTLALLVASRSATGLVLGTGFALAMLVWHVHARRPRLRLMLGCVLATGLGVATALILGLGIAPVGAALSALGKAPDLTGRTDLWQVALGLIRSEPLLGQGYLAYWTAPEFAQEARLLGVVHGSTVTSFHNFALEILVMTGVPGAAAMAVLLGSVIVRLGALPQGPERRWALTSLGLMIALSLLGSSLYRPHEITLFLIAALGAAAGAHLQPASAPRGARTS